MNRKSNIENSQITGVVLAGGKATRMGGIDKGLVELNGIPMCKVVIDQLDPQVAEVLVNANRNIEVYEGFGVRVVQDQMQGFLGPLAGLFSAMSVATTPWVVTVPCDGPFLNTDYVKRMMMASDDVDIVVARDERRLQPTFILSKTRLMDDLEDFLQSGERKIDRWFVKHNWSEADFSDSPDCFLNINTEQDRDNAQLRMNQSA